MQRAWLWLLLAALWVPCSVSAQDDREETTSEPSQASDAATSEAAPPVAPTTAPTWWFGGYLHGTFVPSFMLNLFLESAPTVSNAAFGFTATHRSADGMSLVLGLGYAGYSFDGPYQAKGDPITDTEFLQSSLGLLHLRAQILWSSEIVKDKLSFEYGVGLDFGVVLGSLYRSEAYPDGAVGFLPCAGAGDGGIRGNVPPGPYCEPTTSGALTDGYDQEGAHYHVLEKRVPPVMAIPMLPALALRYTPIRSLAVKLDASFGLLQFAVGLSAAYGVDL